jgi:invasion protein IalB
MSDSNRRLVQFGIPALLFVFGAFAGWIGHALVAPPGQTGTVATFGGWTVSCPPFGNPKATCTMSMPIVDRQSGTTFASLIMGRAPEGLKLAVTLPLSVYLMPGMALGIGSDPPKPYHYDTCTLQGCVTAVTVDDKLLASLRSAKKATLEFAIPNKDNKPVGLTVSIDGFDKADDAFAHDEALRHSWFWRLWS